MQAGKESLKSVQSCLDEQQTQLQAWHTILRDVETAYHAAAEAPRTCRPSQATARQWAVLQSELQASSGRAPPPPPLPPPRA